jgi:hypothetical protein
MHTDVCHARPLLLYDCIPRACACLAAAGPAGVAAPQVTDFVRYRRE